MIKENILYGNDEAKDSEVQEAATIANAIEFISSSQLNLAFEESGHTLYNAFQQYKDEITLKIGEEEYKKKLDGLQELSKKE